MTLATDYAATDAEDGSSHNDMGVFGNTLYATLGAFLAAGPIYTHGSGTFDPATDGDIDYTSVTLPATLGVLDAFTANAWGIVLPAGTDLRFWGYATSIDGTGAVVQHDLAIRTSTGDLLYAIEPGVIQDGTADGTRSLSVVDEAFVTGAHIVFTLSARLAS